MLRATLTGGPTFVGKKLETFQMVFYVAMKALTLGAPNVSGFIVQLVRALHRYCKVTGSNPVEVLTFSGFYTQLLKLRT